MKIEDHGVIEPSFMDFIVPSDFAKEALYILNIGDANSILNHSYFVG